jgi:hypothetical protein
MSLTRRYVCDRKQNRVDETMNSDDNNHNDIRKERHPAPEGGGWVDYVEARLDMRERTERLRALRLRKQASERQRGNRPPMAKDQAKPTRRRA